VNLPATLPREILVLERKLRRRFRTVVSDVPMSGGPLSLLHPASAEELISEEDFLVDERLPYWADIWPSSRILADRISRGEGSGRRMLELGCGVGLVSAAALRAGHDVTATDYYDDALLFTRVNGWRIARREPATRLVDWRDMPEDLGRFDLVVAADVLYERPYGRVVAEAVARTLDQGGEALIADPGRVAAGDFVSICGALGLAVIATRVPFRENEIKQTITLFSARWSEGNGENARARAQRAAT
jgi:predicted nicotinamide N-methyase